MIRDDEYIPLMLVALCDAQGRNLISILEEKRLADDLVDNKRLDIIEARLFLASQDLKDEAEGINHY